MILLATACAHAEDWTTTKKACQLRRPFLPWLSVSQRRGMCRRLFTLDPVGPAVGSVTTGSGFGGGFHFVKQATANNTFTVKSIYTYNSSRSFPGKENELSQLYLHATWDGRALQSDEPLRLTARLAQRHQVGLHLAICTEGGECRIQYGARAYIAWPLNTVMHPFSVPTSGHDACIA
jgi:hypothetical protein